MDIQQATDKIIQEFSTIYKETQKAVLWAGRIIEERYTNYLVPLLKQAWSQANSNFNTFFTQIKTGPGMIFAIAGGLFIAGVTAFKIADHKAYEDDVLAKTSWKALGIINFAAATIATSLGMAAMMI